MKNTPMLPPDDYLERVYAGVLGKIIGVYLGRPFEQWSHEKIEKELGEIWYYVHERRNMPLIVTDDDITGTFTFIRALEDCDCSPDLTPQQIGEAWLNYIIENKTILWWGGMGVSTEHTAFRRLQDGIAAPRSGSTELNSQVVAEQIGAQIFIDGWAMVAPNDPARAADFARRAGSVSHDGEAIYGAQVIAAMESAAFGEKDLNTLIDIGLQQIPADCTIAKVINDLRDCRRRTDTWRDGLKLIHERYSYEKFGGGCHVVPNFAVVMLGLLWGDDDFQKSQMITNTAGYDTDCNAGNVGCLMGIKNGLAGIQAGADFRGPVADRLYLPTAEAGSGVSDAAQVALRIANMGLKLAGLTPVAPKDGARYHFSLPGSVQGFTVPQTIESTGAATVDNVNGRLRIRYHGLAPGRVARASTSTFIPRQQNSPVDTYHLIASPTIYSGQVVTANFIAASDNTGPIEASLFLYYYGDKDEPALLVSPAHTVAPGQSQQLTWTVPELNGQPIFEIGLQLCGTHGTSGSVDLDRLTWTGEPNTILKNYPGRKMSQRAWAQTTSHLLDWYTAAIGISQDRGQGLLITGTRQWRNISVSTTLTPHLARRFGLAIRVQGLRRYYAAVLDDGGFLSIIRMLNTETTLARTPLQWKQNDAGVSFSLTAAGNKLTAVVGGQTLSVFDDGLSDGGIALFIEDGRLHASDIAIAPATV